MMDHKQTGMALDEMAAMLPHMEAVRVIHPKEYSAVIEKTRKPRNNLSSTNRLHDK